VSKQSTNPQFSSDYRGHARKRYHWLPYRATELVPARAREIAHGDATVPLTAKMLRVKRVPAVNVIALEVKPIAALIGAVEDISSFAGGGNLVTGHGCHAAVPFAVSRYARCLFWTEGIACRTAVLLSVVVRLGAGIRGADYTIASTADVIGGCPTLDAIASEARLRE